MNKRRPAVVRHLFLLPLSLVLLVPFYIALVNAFKTRDDILSRPFSLPLSRLTLDNFQRSAITPSFNIFKAYGNSILITAVSVVLLIFICSMMSFVFARVNNRFLSVSYLLLLLLLSGLMIPPQVILIPLVKVLAKLGLMFYAPGAHSIQHRVLCAVHRVYVCRIYPDPL
jgi:raffinose/stachyose/melibiose transport system permease protein